MPTTSRNEIESRVKQSLAAHLDIPAETIADDALLVDQLGLDSFGMVELMFELEDATGVEIAAEDQPRIRSVRDLVNVVADRLGAA